MSLFLSLKSKPSIKAALLVIPYLGLFGVHVVGITSHSNYMLHQFFDASTYTQLFAEFSLHALFAFSIARLAWFLIRGFLLRFIQLGNFFAGKYGITWRNIRIVTVTVARSSQFNGLAVTGIAFWMFCKTYLGLGTITSVFYFFLPLFIFAMLMASESNLLIAAKHVRGDDNVKFGWRTKSLINPRQTPDEERVDPLLMAKFTKNTGQILLMILLVGTWTSYAMGKARDYHLRTELAFKDQDNDPIAIIAKTGDGFIIWRSSTNSYSLAARDALLSLPAQEQDDELAE